MLGEWNTPYGGTGGPAAAVPAVAAAPLPTTAPCMPRTMGARAAPAPLLLPALVLPGVKSPIANRGEAPEEAAAVVVPVGMEPRGRLG